MTKWKMIYIYNWIFHSSSWHWSFQIYGRVPKMPTQLPYLSPLKATTSKRKSSWNKVSLQICLERNLINPSYIFILSVNFENLTVRLHVLITSLMLTKYEPCYYISKYEAYCELKSYQYYICVSHIVFVGPNKF